MCFLGVFTHYCCYCLLSNRISEASNISHLEKVERGYENMDHFTVSFLKERRALRSIDFSDGKDIY